MHGEISAENDSKPCRIVYFWLAIGTSARWRPVRLPYLLLPAKKRSDATDKAADQPTARYLRDIPHDPPGRGPGIAESYPGDRRRDDEPNDGPSPTPGEISFSPRIGHPADLILESDTARFRIARDEIMVRPESWPRLTAACWWRCAKPRSSRGPCRRHRNKRRPGGRQSRSRYRRWRCDAS